MAQSGASHVREDPRRNAGLGYHRASYDAELVVVRLEETIDARLVFDPQGVPEAPGVYLGVHWVVDIGGVPLGIAIAEDIFNDGMHPSAA